MQSKIINLLQYEKENNNGIVIASVSGMLYAEKLPRIEMRMSNGALVTDPITNEQYIGYDEVCVKHTGFWFWEKVTVKCINKGHERCRSIIDGEMYYWVIDNNDGVNSYYFNNEVLMKPINSILDEIDKISFNNNNNKQGKKTKTVSIYDKDGIQRFIAIKVVYNIDTTYSGSIDVYLNVIN